MLCFPQVAEMRLRRSPLREVICQVRFPPQLRILNEYPVAFQERIRARFPDLGTVQQVQLEMKPLAEEPAAAKAEPPVFRFASSDEETLATLGFGFYALSTTAYTHWPAFLEHLLFLSQAARDVYELPYATRVGLRYINQIAFDNTGINTTAKLWNVLRPELTALLRSECWSDPQKMDIRLALIGEEDQRFTLRCAFAADEQPTLILDFDYFSQGRICLDSLPTICEHYHEIIYRAFRWCIPDDQLGVFDPVPANEED